MAKMARNSTAALTLPLVLLLSLGGCGPQNGISASDQQRLTAQFYDFLKSKTFSAAKGRELCTRVFDLSPPTLVDSTITGTTGKLRISVNVTFKGPYRYPAFGTFVVIYPADPCYGAPRGGLVPGGQSTSTYDVQIERWDSGWRIVQPQSFNLI